MRDSRAEAAFLHIIDTSRLIKHLKDDKREIFRAAAAAQKAADYCLAFHPDFAESELDQPTDHESDDTATLAEAA